MIVELTLNTKSNMKELLSKVKGYIWKKSNKQSVIMIPLDDKENLILKYSFITYTFPLISTFYTYL